MTTTIPDKIKAADLTRFIVRASQLEHARPVVAYWCEYWIVNQILAKGLHNADSEAFNYTMALMDKLEKIKADNATNDAIIDDTAGQAYVEHFGLETFFRADRAVKANRVTKQTADTFQAAATFLELINIWMAPDAETKSKIRFAKWNAVRIVKAIKEGKDPNASNPKVEPVAEENLPALDPNDPEVQAFQTFIPQKASIEDVPEEQDTIEAKLARQSSTDQSPHSSTPASRTVSPTRKPFDPYPKDGFPYTSAQDDNVSPMEPTPPARDGSIGGGYFPEVPSASAQDDDIINLRLPQQPSAPPGSDDFESFPPPALPNDPRGESYKHSSPPQSPAEPQALPKQSLPRSQDMDSSKPPIQSQGLSTLQYTPASYTHSQPPYQEVPHFHQRDHQSDSTIPSTAAKQPYITDDMAIAKAQKHAKWAISALNFEDAETAVRELREALKTLGAS